MTDRATRSTPRRVLVVCTRLIGDVLLSTPLVRSLKQAWPNAEVDVLVFEGTDGVLAGNPDIHRILTTPRREPLRSKIAYLRPLWRTYDLAVAVTPSDRARLYGWAAARRRVGLVTPGAKDWAKRWLLHVREPFDNVHTHTVTMGLQLARALDLAPAYAVVPPTAGGVGWARLTARLAAEGRPLPEGRFAVVHVAPRFTYKRWHVAGWRTLIAWLRQQGLAIVLTGGPDAEERAYVDEIMAGVEGPVTDLVGALKIPETADVISHAALFVGPDTMATHMAAATGVPVVALFGPSNPVKWAPWPAAWTQLDSPWRMQGSQRQGNVFLVQGAGPCVPCAQEGCDRHRRSASRCLDELPAATVIDAAARMLGQVPAAPLRMVTSAASAT
ncbi:glycosyltransferase family 9 protein [Imbroritus primus]|uniref:Glycosyltransferase family 9 protein n=1 Tax=Imbroritus primus TaxID=3058603 RepID=A0ACD3SP51_9BURK|nr:glycosyltransferase family 9 protein [Burkholderiaceae bacterium PBA]